ncbi:MAG: ABC transporter ATP-binding protein [Truepera sp.]|nr:ABC transporter ATP-binding protein [Truepera sp.]
MSESVPMIDLQEVFKVYDMGDVDVPALDGVDFQMNRGEFVSLVGDSGSGKSTMLHIVGGLDKPTGGKYYLEGNEVLQLRDRELSRIRNRHFGFVFQAYNLISNLTAQENVEQPLIYAGLTKRQRTAKAKRTLEKVGLEARSKHLPGQLSGGQQQRIAIARALVNDPTLIMADEPTGNLNTEAGNLILDILSSLHEEGVSILMVTHSREIANRADRRVELQDGKIIGEEVLS